jgi:hypothetical protein
VGLFVFDGVLPEAGRMRGLGHQVTEHVVRPMAAKLVSSPKEKEGGDAAGQNTSVCRGCNSHRR